MKQHPASRPQIRWGRPGHTADTKFDNISDDSACGSMSALMIALLWHSETKKSYGLRNVRDRHRNNLCKQEGKKHPVTRLYRPARPAVKLAVTQILKHD